MDSKRDLYAPLRRPEDFQLTWPLLPGEEPPSQRKTLPACSGACQQGRRLCLTPEACRLPDGHAQMEGAGAVVIPAVVAAVLAVAALVTLVWSWI